MEVDRPGLDGLLDAAATHRLTIVSAGPGWGKTTAVARWVRERRTRAGQATAWLTLEAADDSPAAFWDAVLYALATAGVVPDGHPLSMVSASAGVSEEVLLTLFRGLGSLPKPSLIVLEDFHLIEHADILTALGDLVSHETPVRLMLLTRHDPALPLHRLRLGGNLAEVRAAELAFDGAAVIGLARGAESLDLLPAQVEHVLNRTEGWPAGVRLATLHLSRSGADRGLADFAGTERSVAEYLVAEILERHDVSMQDFLMRTSVAERLSGDLADAVVSGGNGLARLEKLERTNQFVVAVDAERTSFRYHPLLRDLLLHTLRRDDPEGYRAAHRAAAGWLVSHGDPVSALSHAAAAEDWALTTQVFFESSASLVGAQRFAVRTALQAIPFETLPSTAALELCAAGVELVSGHLDAIGVHVEQARHHGAGADDLPPMGAALLENLACVAARVDGDSQAVIASAKAALTHLADASPGHATVGLRTISVTQRAVGLLWSGDTPAARDVFLATVKDPQPGDVALTVIGARAYLAWCDLLAGSLDQAEARARDVIEDASALGWTSLLQLRPAYVALATSSLLRADAETADRAMAAGLAADVGGVEWWPTIALQLTQSSIAVSRNRPRAAAAALTKACASEHERPRAPALADILLRAQTDFAVLTGDLAAPRAEEEDGLRASRRSATSWSGRARIAIARGDLAAAQKAASRVPRPPDSDDLVDLLAGVEAWLVLALVADQHGHPREAIEAIQAAVELARAERLVRPFLVTGSDRTMVLLQRLLTGAAYADEFVRRILARSSRPDPTVREPEPLIEQLTERELAILAELPTMKSNAEIAAEFYVSQNTVKAHLKHMYRKLGVPSRREAVRRGRELGLIP